MKIIPFCLTLGLALSNLTYAADLDLAGKWRTIDDKTGFSKGIVEINKDNQGIYTGVVIEILPRPGYVPKTLCQNCPEPYTDKPILGLPVLYNMHLSDIEGKYIGGKILDPLSGKTYRSSIRVSPDGKRLTMRGFYGIELIGRSQTWIRVE